MKYIYIIVFSLLLLSCGNNTQPVKPRFKVGDIVYLKPDSLKCVIVHYYELDKKYDIQYTDVYGRIRTGERIYSEDMFY